MLHGFRQPLVAGGWDETFVGTLSHICLLPGSLNIPVKYLVLATVRQDTGVDGPLG